MFLRTASENLSKFSAVREVCESPERSSFRTFTTLSPSSPKLRCGRGSRVVKVSDRGLPCHELEPNISKEPPCRAAIHI
ncbi:hypothetical protein TNCV_4791871 [Trichonephila clavipes]|nr:hypothetical protein TNCV_4791871 [Trichonephila clavipes]